MGIGASDNDGGSGHGNGPSDNDGGNGHDHCENKNNKRPMAARAMITMSSTNGGEQRNHGNGRWGSKQQPDNNATNGSAGWSVGSISFAICHRGRP